MKSRRVTKQRRPRLHPDAVARSIRGKIQTGSLLPDQRLVENDLMSDHRVSRACARMALRQLESEGLVEIVKNRGAVVRRIGRAEVLHILEVLDELDVITIRRVTAAIADQDKRRGVKAALARAQAFKRELKRVQPVARYVEETNLLWNTLTTIAGNPILEETHTRLQALLHRILLAGLQFAGDENRWVSHHVNLLRAVLDGDAEGAVKAMRTAAAESRAAIASLPDASFG